MPYCLRNEYSDDLDRLANMTKRSGPPSPRRDSFCTLTKGIYSLVGDNLIFLAGGA
jgi:hypothetical protein